MLCLWFYNGSVSSFSEILAINVLFFSFLMQVMGGAQAAGLQAAGKGHTCPRPLQPSGRESRRGPAPGTRGLKGRHGERGFGAMAEAGCRKGSAELPWELGAPAPGGSLSREDRTRPQLRLAAPAPLPWDERGRCPSEPTTSEAPNLEAGRTRRPASASQTRGRQRHDGFARLGLPRPTGTPV